jgi:type II secretory pathway component PulK
MDLIQKSKSLKKTNESLPVGRDSSGIALFMVIAAVSVLAILVTEFTYIAQVSQMIAFGGLDQTQAHYLAKSGLKISLLRLKAYQQVKTLANSLGGGAGIPGVPKSLLEKIWSFPFFYPIPTNIPGMSINEKEAIEKFTKESGFEGKFSALIESESSKYNLNLLLGGYAPSATPVASPSPNTSPVPPQNPNPQAQAPNPNASFNPQDAQVSLYDYLNALWLQKLDVDPDFASMYRDLRLGDLVDGIAGWADRTHERRMSASQDKVPPKKAPFYSVSELHMVPMMDDELYQLFAPNLTASTTSGININTMQEATLRAILRNNITKDEGVEFFKFRDNEDVDNKFKKEDDFFNYLSKNVNAYKNNQQMITDLKNNLIARQIRLVTDESNFKIVVQAQVNSATRTIEAWVTLGAGTPNPNPSATPTPTPTPTSAQTNPTGVVTAPKPDSGIKITFMKIR